MAGNKHTGINMSVYDRFFPSQSPKDSQQHYLSSFSRPSFDPSECNKVLTDRDYYKTLIEKYGSSNSTPLSKFSDRIKRMDNYISFNVSEIPEDEPQMAETSDLQILKIEVPSKANKDYPATSSTRFSSLVSQSPYLNSDWLTQFQTKCNHKEQLLKEKEKQEVEKLRFWSKQREICQTSDIRSLSSRLNLLLKEPGVVEDIEPEPEPKPEPLPELTPDVFSGIKEVMAIRNPSQVVSNAFRLEITRGDLETLTGRNWLSDNIINFYMQLISHRSTTSSSLPKVAVLTTFFFPKLKQSGFASVKRWTRKSELFNQDLVMIPIHLGVHWCLSCVDMRTKQIKYYDSMGGHNYDCLSILLRFLEEESMDKRSQPLDTSAWSVLFPENIPQQENGFDCGMFSCCFAEFLSRDRDFTFSQKDMPYFRQRFIYEIYRQKLL